MSKINETNYPRRTQANYADTDMLVIQAAGGNTYTTRLEDMREDYEETLAPSLSALQDDINENLATIEAGSTASKVYAKGDYLVFGGKLCRVTSTSIAAGATLTIGTNIELAPVGDELKTLSSQLTSLPIKAFSLKSGSPLRFYISSYGVALIFGFINGVGSKCILIQKSGSSVSSIDMSNNSAWSSTHFDIHVYSSDDNYIEITSDRSGSSTGTYLTGF
jgi:hypothetical protein